MRITIEDTDNEGRVDEKWIVEGDFVQLLDLYRAFKRLTLGVGHHHENVEKYFGDCENWSAEYGEPIE